MTSREIIDNSLCPTLAVFKNHIRLTVSDTNMDADLTLKLKAAILAAENFIGYRLALSSYTLRLSFSRTVTLDYAPVATVTSVSVDGVALTAADYNLSGNVLSIADWVSGSSMEIVYTAGYSDYEEPIKSAILLMATALFNNPNDSVESLPKASTNLLRPYRKYR